MDIEIFCRLCALPGCHLVKIFGEEGLRLNIESNINKCLKIEICEKDHLPRAVCNECCQKLLSTCDFIDASLKAQETLQRVLEETDLLKKENCPVLENNLGGGSKHSSDPLISALEEENKGAGKVLISIDEVDSSIIEDYVEGLNSKYNYARANHNFLQSLGRQSGDEVFRNESPRAFSFFTNLTCNESSVKNSSASNLSCQDAEADSRNAEEVSGSKRVICQDLIPEGLIRINKGIFKGNGKEHFEKESEVIKVECRECDAAESDEKSGDSGIQFAQNKRSVEECIESETSIGRKGNTAVRREKSESAFFDDVMWPCARCGQLFTQQCELQLHYSNIHGGPTVHMCPVCRKEFTKSTSFYIHLKKHKPSFNWKPLKPTRSKLSCDKCKEKFSNRKLLLAHMVVHSNEQLNSCEDCGKNFPHQSLLELHSRSHLPPDLKYKFQCDLCDKRFSTKPNLITHRRIHSGVKNYTCDQCGKGFTQKGNLDAHLLTHSSDKPFTCDICEKGFKSLMQLRKHHSVHTGDKPHQCDVCGRMFRERGTLREHHRIHTGAMPFSCEYCGKTFRFKGILTTHRRQHTGERPYSCQECQHHFTNWPNYNKHMKRRHGVNTSKTSRVKSDPSVPLLDEAPKPGLSDTLNFHPNLGNDEPYDQLPIIDWAW